MPSKLLLLWLPSEEGEKLLIAADDHTSRQHCTESQSLVDLICSLCKVVVVINERVCAKW